ncbi:MAG: glycosyltransferase family 2 protein [Acidobacteriota bacterium]|nr:glycosyltransferase family 2 protein [Acidobacteriota bacterium]
MTAPPLLIFLLEGFALLTLVYFVALNSLYLVFSIMAFVRLRIYRRRWTSRHVQAVVRSSATPGISLIVPAFNEAETLAESVRALQLLSYPTFEVIVVNDGATDDTMAVLAATFSLARAPVSYPQPIPTQSVIACYRSLESRDLLVIHKANGGKSDAINAGINAARHPLICIIDADSLLEDGALTRAVLPFLESPDTIAAGGIVRIANGCTISDGRVTRVGLPRRSLATFQVVEYLRAFLAARVAHSWMNALLIISGAFGVFRRDALLEAGGFRTDTVGEDMEIVTRLHRLYRESGRSYRIVFQPEPVCWTQAPETFASLAGQRRRWHRGTLEVLAAHHDMIGRPRYGATGCFAMPYHLIFEALGPIVEVAGYAITIAAVAFGLLDWRFAEMLFLAAVAYGAMISVAAVILEEASFRRYPSVRDLLWLSLFGVLENFGYRQLSMWWRLRGSVDFLRQKRGWGTMTRKRFDDL